MNTQTQKKPRSPVHERMRSKNWAVIGAVFGFVFIVFAVTIFKILSW